MANNMKCKKCNTLYNAKTSKENLCKKCLLETTLKISHMEMRIK